jgi:LysM repeat protein
MARRSPARLLAPLALVGFVVALFVVVDSSSTGDGDAQEGTSGRPAATRTAAPAPKKRSQGRRTYVVKPGDTPSSIAEKTNVPLSRIQELNPNLDDQLLAPGDRIKLR